MKCLLDLDGLLANFVKAFCLRHGVANPYETGELVGDWHFTQYLGLDAEVHELEGEFWRTLERMPDADDIFNTVVNRFGKQNVRILTAGNNHPECEQGKHDWMRNNYPGVPVTIDRDKAFYAHGDVVLIDDGDHNVDSFIAAGGHGILVPRIWNSLHHKKDIYLPHYLGSELDAIFNRKKNQT